MAAILRVSPDADAVWLTSGWMFRLVLQSIEAETSDRDLIATLDEIIQYNLPSLSLPELPAAQRTEAERIIRDRLIPRFEQDLPASAPDRQGIIDDVRVLPELLASAAPL